MSTSQSLRCLWVNLPHEKCKDDGCSSHSYVEQAKVESSIGALYGWFRNASSLDSETLELLRKKHNHFLNKGLSDLPESYECLDASRPWMCYWILHSLLLLDEPISDEIKSSVAQFLGKCQNPDGGYGGGPGQLSHLAPTYAAVNALCILGTEEAFKIINRETLQTFLLKMRMPDGGFAMHEDGEADVRGAYCCAAIATLINIATQDIFIGTPEWIVSCQTYEGGFGGLPGMEAHGGYSFCALAALILLNKEKLCDVDALLRWTTNKQMRFEGGFQGRTNKLVDGCYTFWQGAIVPLIHGTLFNENDASLSEEKWMFHQGALQEYVLICCQCPYGGLVDKPGKTRDFYHTCYCLSGLSVAQHYTSHNYNSRHVVGNRINELKRVHPVYNICVDEVASAIEYYRSLPVPLCGSEKEGADATS